LPSNSEPELEELVALSERWAPRFVGLAVEALAPGPLALAEPPVLSDASIAGLPEPCLKSSRKSKAQVPFVSLPELVVPLKPLVGLYQ